MTAKKKPDAIMVVPESHAVPLNAQEGLPIAKTVEDQVNLLSIPTPTRYIKKRVGRGQKVFDYIEANYVIARLNATFFYNWDVETVWQEVNKQERQVAVKVRLTARFADNRTVVKEAYGSSEIKMTKTGDQVDFADDLKAAESDGLKKAASMLGIGWDVYAGLAHAVDEAVDVEEEDDFSDPNDKEKYRNVTLQLANGKTVMVSKFEALGYYGKVKEALGEDAYYATLKLNGFNKANEIPTHQLPVIYAILVNAFKSRKKVEPKVEKHE